MNDYGWMPGLQYKSHALSKPVLCGMHGTVISMVLFVESHTLFDCWLAPYWRCILVYIYMVFNTIRYLILITTIFCLLLYFIPFLFNAVLLFNTILYLILVNIIFCLLSNFISFLFNSVLLFITILYLILLTLYFVYYYTLFLSC